MTAPTDTPLLNCPFCGSAALILDNEFGKTYFVGCESCGGNAGTVENWNRRAVLPSQQPAREAEGLVQAKLDDAMHWLERVTAQRNEALDKLEALTRQPAAAAGWQTIESAPMDGTWILGANNRGNRAVIIWSDTAHDRDRIIPGWIHPFSDGALSPFWNGACGSVPTHWMPLPTPPAAPGKPQDEKERT